MPEQLKASPAETTSRRQRGDPHLYSAEFVLIYHMTHYYGCAFSIKIN